MKKIKKVLICAGFTGPTAPAYIKQTERAGEILAENNITMVFGIGDEGGMGAAMRGVRRKGGKILGFTTPLLLKLQCKNPDMFSPDEYKVMDVLSEREEMLYDSADAMLAAPGGWGTLDEILGFAVRIQVGEMPKKPLIILNTKGFWDPLKAQMKRMLRDKSINKARLDFIEFIDDAEEMLPAMARVKKRMDTRHYR